MDKIWIYESELKAIGAETCSWAIETGGDLFGTWEPQPVIWLATRMGPNSSRTTHHCRFDLQYLERLSRTLADEWELAYFGDWHSHGFSDLSWPSRMDCERIGRILERNRFPRLLELISTRRPETARPREPVAVRGFDFPTGKWFDPSNLELIVLPRISPLREMFRLRRESELAQDWTAGTAFSLSSIEGISIAGPDAVVWTETHRYELGQRAIDELVCSLEDEYPQARVELHSDQPLELKLCAGQGWLLMRFARHWPYRLEHIQSFPPPTHRTSTAACSPVTSLQPADLVKLGREWIESVPHDVTASET